jgi:hypothetical protein
MLLLCCLLSHLTWTGLLLLRGLRSLNGTIHLLLQVVILR